MVLVECLKPKEFDELGQGRDGILPPSQSLTALDSSSTFALFCQCDLGDKLDFSKPWFLH